jgi:nicotinamide riboside kinase
MTNTIKIALMGTSCVGKTTIFEALREKFGSGANISFIPEAARRFFEENGTSERFTLETQRKIQELVIKSEKELAPGTEIIICDRTVIDPAAYCLANEDLEGTKGLLDAVAGWLPSYAELILLDPKDVPYKTDEIRGEAEEYRQKVHEAFLKILKDRKLKYSLLSGSLERRLEYMEELVGRYLP